MKQDSASTSATSVKTGNAIQTESHQPGEQQLVTFLRALPTISPFLAPSLNQILPKLFDPILLNGPLFAQRLTTTIEPHSDDSEPVIDPLHELANSLSQFYELQAKTNQDDIVSINQTKEQIESLSGNIVSSVCVCPHSCQSQTVPNPSLCSRERSDCSTTTVPPLNTETRIGTIQLDRVQHQPTDRTKTLNSGSVVTSPSISRKSSENSPMAASSTSEFRLPRTSDFSGLSNTAYHNQTGMSIKHTSSWSPGLGVPKPATPTRFTAPVHVDVGGVLYTSSLETLTKYPNSRLGRMFNGVIPIVLDTMKQHYFIDRDGALFRHVLNFLRTGQLHLDAQYEELDQLIQEAQHYELTEMLIALKELCEKRTHLHSTVNRKRPYWITPPILQVSSKRRRRGSVVSEGTNSETHTYDSNHPVTSSSTSEVNLGQNGSFPSNFVSTNCPQPDWACAHCIWLELDEVAPHSGMLQCTTCDQITPRIERIYRFLDRYSAQLGVTVPKNASSIEPGNCRTWKDMSRNDQLRLWQLILSEGYEIVATHRMSKVDKRRLAYLLYHSQM
ncbi:BTB/POZ domain-containing protein KCTD1/15 [Paragonimus westermani]|uniref:BTB/POZ domain-containing protein KCTD1/15 n=1 Tax=Paragonimus westermani TaxID=34504 RepID=A0A5J4NG93_9TREM|nr:BTB/POZ domain-containing protein KCTD1/15 [Paragonimus westermani]